MTVAKIDVRHAIGGNNPPAPSPYEAHKTNIEDLVLEARNWADSSAVESQAQADEISRLIEDLRTAMQAADASRIEENKPFDDGKAAVQAKYNALIADTKTQKGAAVRAIDALKATLKPFLDKLAADKKAEADRLQKEADEKAEAARAALRSAQPDNLESREAAEAVLDDAKRAQQTAARAANDKAQARGGSRALGLKTVNRPEMTDAKAALIHYMTAQPAAIKACLQQLAETDWREGKRSVPGFKNVEETRL